MTVGTPNRLSKLAESGDLNLSALRYVLVDCLPDERNLHIFSRSKDGGRRPDADDLSQLLSSAAFKDALARGEKRAPTLCPVLLPPKEALEASTPVGQRMDIAARKHGRGRGGKGGGGKGRGGKGGKGRGGKGGGRGAIHKKRR